MPSRQQTVNVVKKIDRFTGGLNTEHPVTIKDDELTVATNVEYTTEGRIRVRTGSQRRFSTDFSTEPVLGMAPFYKSDGTTRLVFASGTTIYADNPHLSFSYDTQADFKQAGVLTNLDTDSSPGDIIMMEVLNDGFEDGNFNRWTSRDSGWTIDTSVYKSGTASAKGSGSNQKLVWELKGSSAYVYVRLACRFAEANVAHYPISFISPSGSVMSVVTADSDGKFKYHNGSAYAEFPTTKTYSAITWYVIEVWVKDGTFWVSIDGQSLTPNGLVLKDTSNNPQSQIAKLMIQNAGTTAGTMWVDDVYLLPKAAVFSRASVAYKSDGTQVAANVPRFEDFNLIPETKRKFEGWIVAGGAVVTVTQNQTVTEWNTSAATRIQTSGGVETLKYYTEIVLPSENGQYYHLYVKIKNVGTKTVRIGSNFGGKYQDVLPGETKNVFIQDILGDGTNNLQLRFDALNAGDSLDFYAYMPYAWKKEEYLPPEFGQAVLMEEGTTNLLTAAQSTATGGLAVVGTHGSKGTLTYITTDGWTDGNCAQVVVSGFVAGDDVNLATADPSEQQDTAVSPNTTYTFSAYVKAPAGIDYDLRVIEWGSAGTVVGDTTLSTLTGNGTWQRIIGTLTTKATTAYVSLRIQFQGNGTFLIDGLQIEQKPYATSWVPGGATRSNEILTIPTAGVLNPQEGTVEFWARTLDLYSRRRDMFTVNKPVSSDDRVILGYNVTGTGLELYWRPANATAYAIRATNLGAVTDWVYAGFRYRWNGTGYDLALLYNGQVVATGTATNGQMTNFYQALLGCTDQGSGVFINYADMLFGDLRISSRARTDEEILAAYQSGMPLEWDVDTTYLLDFDGDFTIPADRQGVWVSPVHNASNLKDYSGLTVSWEDVQPAYAAVACQVRTSPDGINWSMWYDQINGEYSSAPPNPYSQVRFILQLLNNEETPRLKKVVVSYGAPPNAQPIKTGMSTAPAYSFAQLTDLLIICNGVDTPLKYDGNTVTEIPNAPRAYLACVYKNRLFLAKTANARSTIWFSGIQNVDDWTSTDTGAIDINPNDGDEIMALLPTMMTLLVVKRRSTYYLGGYSPETFQVSPAGAGGTVSPWGVVWTPYGMFRLDTDGVWLTNFQNHVLLTNKIRHIWENLNHRNLHKAALAFYKDKLLVAVPSAGSSYNDLILVFDMLTKGWTVWEGLHASVFSEFIQYGKTHYLFGASDRGNVFELTGTTDDGKPITGSIATRHMPLVSEEVLKRIRWFDVYFGNSEGQEARVVVSSIVNGVSGPSATVTIPPNTNTKAFRMFSQPYCNTFGVKIDITGPAVFQGVSITYYPRAIRAERV